MIIAALVVFGALLVAWIVVPAEPRTRDALVETVEAVEAVEATLAEAA